MSHFPYVNTILHFNKNKNVISITALKNYHLFYSHFVLALNEEPEFVEQIENATVPVGRNVKLSCSVRSLGTYKVSK